MPEPIAPTQPAQPTQPTQPTQLTQPAAVDKSSAVTKLAAELEKAFPHGVIPEGQSSNRGALARNLISDPATVEADAKKEAEEKAAAEAKAIAEKAAAQTPEQKLAAVAEKAAAEKVALEAEAARKAAADKDKPSKEQLDAAEKVMDLKAGTAFKHVRQELADSEKARNEEKTAAEARIRDLEAKASAVNEVEVKELREKADRYERELAVTHVEATDGFQKEIAKPLEAAQKSLEALALKYEITPSALHAAMSDPDTAKRSDKLSELSTNFNRLDTVRFDQLTLEIDRLGNRKQLALDEATQRLAEFQKQQDAESKKRLEGFRQDWTNALETSRATLEKELPVFKKTGDEKWDAKLEEALVKVKGVDLTQVSNEDLAKSLYKAGIFPLVLSLIGDLYGENTVLADRLAKYQAATPGAGIGNPPPNEPEKPKPGSMVEALKVGLQGVLPP